MKIHQLAELCGDPAACLTNPTVDLPPALLLPPPLPPPSPPPPPQDIWHIFFICSTKSPQCTDKYSKKNFDSDFPSPCFDVPKASNFTSGGVQNTRPKPGDWERLWRHFRAPSFAKKDFSVIFLLWANQFAKKWYNSPLFIRWPVQVHRWNKTQSLFSVGSLEKNTISNKLVRIVSTLQG